MEAMTESAFSPGPDPDAERDALGATDLLEVVLRRLGADDPGSDGAADAAAGTAGDAPSAATATLGDLVNELDERAFGFMLLLLALPCCLPFIYLLPQIVALPMLALAAQLGLGREAPWLPGPMAARRFEVSSFLSVVKRTGKYARFLEAFARPRFLFLSGHVGARVVGAVLMIPCASILVPLPGTNTVPGIGVAITALGLVERDGVLIVLGLVIGFTWVALLSIFGLEAATIIKDWVAARL